MAAAPGYWAAAAGQPGYDAYYGAHAQYWGNAGAYPSGYAGYDYNAYQQQQAQPTANPPLPSDQGPSGETNPPLPGTESPPPPPPGGSAPPAAAAAAPPLPPGPAPPAPPPSASAAGVPPPAPPPGQPPATAASTGTAAGQPDAAAYQGGYNTSGYAAPGYHDPAYVAYYQQQYAQYGGWGQGWGHTAQYPGYMQPSAQQQAYGAYPQQQQQQQQQQGLQKQPSSSNALPSPSGASSTHQTSYNSVPPPSSLSGSGGDASNATNLPRFSIRPQFGKAGAFPNRLGKVATVEASTAQHAGAGYGQGTAQQGAGSRPAYLKVSLPTAPVQQPLASPSSATPVRTTPTPAAGAAAAAPRKFPPSFTAWVERCFSKCRTSEDRQAMTGMLTAKIKEVEKVGRMWLMDWDQEPLPVLPGAAAAGATVTREREHYQRDAHGGSLPSPSSRGRGGFGAGGATRPGSSQWKRGRGQDSPPEDYDRDDSGDDSDDGRYAQRRQDFRGGKAGKQGRGGKQDAGAMKKRKKGFDAEEVVPQLSGADLAKLQGRAGRFGDGRAVGGLQSWQRRGPGAAQGGRGRQGWRFEEEAGSDEELDLSNMMVIQGTCQELEKSYFRLTAAPDPSVVRPELVLRRALQRLVGLLRSESSGVNWFYACDQFKGMRQDCTVQRLRNALAVEVYEAHARAALEYGDLAEFNQCQTQLHAMYADKQPGCVAEFVAYKILYETAHATRPGVGRALLHTMRTALLDASLASSPEVRHAVATRQAVMTSNYTAFFRLYAEAPHLGRALMDLVAPTLRWAALNVMVKAFKTQLPVSFLAPAMGFVPGTSHNAAAAAQPTTPLAGCRFAVYKGRAAAEPTEEDGSSACVEWLRAHGAVVEESEQGAQLDVKGSLGKLSIPEEPKVSHGDENLSLGDFLSAAAKRSATVYL